MAFGLPLCPLNGDGGSTGDKEYTAPIKQSEGKGWGNIHASVFLWLFRRRADCLLEKYEKPLQHKPQRFFALLSSLFSQQRQGPYRVFDGFETR